MIRFLLATTAIAFVTGTCTLAADPFEEHAYKYSGGPYKNEVFKYLVLEPEKIEAGKKYPLMLFLHGAGERGENTQKLKFHLPPLMATAEYRKAYPCFLIVPQCRDGKLWINQHWSEKQSIPMNAKPNHQLQVAIDILKKSLDEFPVDRNRVYLTGLSMGGFGSWELAMRHPELFAAVVPICGGGDESNAKRLANVPVWAVHGDKDGAVSVDRTRRLIALIKQAGGNPKYTELKGVGHNSWTSAYKDPKGVIPWMFQQSLKNRVSNK